MILLFIDGDGSDRPRHIPDLVRPIAAGEADFVHGTRVRGEREAGSLSAPQLLAGRLAGSLIRATFRPIEPNITISSTAHATAGTRPVPEANGSIQATAMPTGIQAWATPARHAATIRITALAVAMLTTLS